MTDLTCYRCGHNHDTTVTCGDAAEDRRLAYIAQARGAIADAREQLCAPHRIKRDQCRECARADAAAQPHDRPTADAGLPEEAAG